MPFVAIAAFMLFVGGWAVLIIMAAIAVGSNQLDRQVIHPPRRTSNAEWRYCDHRRRSTDRLR